MSELKQLNTAGEIRRSQIIQIYGPGSIMNLRYRNVTISTIMADLHMWEYQKTANSQQTKNQKFTDARLSKSINQEVRYKNLYKPKTQIDEFWLPPVVPETYSRSEAKRPHLVTKIFPETLICPECRKIGFISSWGRAGKYDVRKICLNCSRTAKKVYPVPSRFIVCCEAGHIQEFNYRSWLSYKISNFANSKQKECKHKNLYLRQIDGLGLASLVLSCSDCKAKTNMDGVFSEGALDGLICSGHRPWLTVNDDSQEKNEECSEKLKVVQRNSNSVWRAETISALTIPPWDEVLSNQLGSHWKMINQLSTSDMREDYIKNYYSIIKKDSRLDYQLSELIEKIEAEIQKNNTASSDLKFDEYKALTLFEDHKKMDDFQVTKQTISVNIDKFVSLVVAVERIREVRALVAFSRISDKKRPEDVILVPLTDQKDQDWLPVMEVFGEGIFIELNKDLLSSYLSSDFIKRQMEKYYPSIEKDDVLIKKIFFHTFSHLFMRAISTEAGYALASLRERIYDGKDQFGILIYTSTSDSEGTLGGLSRLAKTERMESIIKNTLTYSMICSNDPLCNQGLLSEHENSNGSACHTCLLIPETSCEFFNSHLCRTFIEGIIEKTELF